MLPLDKDMKNIKIVLPCSSVVEQETVNFKVVGPTPTEAAKIANASKGLHTNIFYNFCCNVFQRAILLLSCGCISMVESQFSKLITGVRFPPPAPISFNAVVTQRLECDFSKVEVEISKFSYRTNRA